MTEAGSWARRVGVAGTALSVMAATVALERLTVLRGVRRKARLALDSSGPYGGLRGTQGTALADDGTQLYYEIDEVDDHPGPDAAEAGEGEEGAPSAGGNGAVNVGARLAPLGDGTGGPVVAPVRLPVGQVPPPRRRLFGGRRSRRERRRGADDALPTVVFSHGYCHNQDIWHFQRAALRGAVRCVFWDQRSHGRSERGRAQRENGEPVTIDQLGRDLKAVLDAAVPEGPIVLVGHSMGGMTMMALADQYPDFVADRVVGVAFVGTSAGGLSEVTFGLPEAGAKALNRLAPTVLKALGAQPELVDRARKATADLFTGVIKRYSFGSRDIDPGVARFAERLIESVPIDVVAEFFPAFGKHEKTAALAAFNSGRPALVLIGDRDQVTPTKHSETIAAALKDAELVRAEGAGHLVMLEQPELVNTHLAELLARSIRTHGRTSPPPQGRDHHPDRRQHS